ncbi:MAG: hypothetical protein WCO25_05080 [Candidatus Uhrbacteria bacterium]
MDPWFDHLYTMSNSMNRQALHLDTDETFGRDTADRLLRGDLVPRQPVSFRRKQFGSRPTDLIGTTWAIIELASDKLIDVLRTGKFTGWSTFPVVI